MRLISKEDICFQNCKNDIFGILRKSGSVSKKQLSLRTEWGRPVRIIHQTILNENNRIQASNLAYTFYPWVFPLSLEKNAFNPGFHTHCGKAALTCNEYTLIAHFILQRYVEYGQLRAFSRNIFALFSLSGSQPDTCFSSAFFRFFAPLSNSAENWTPRRRSQRSRVAVVPRVLCERFRGFYDLTLSKTVKW